MRLNWLQSNVIAANMAFQPDRPSEPSDEFERHPLAGAFGTGVTKIVRS
jgi:hypothetical protein